MTMRMPTLLPFGEGCMSGEAVDTRTRSIGVVGTAPTVGKINNNGPINLRGKRVCRSAVQSPVGRKGVITPLLHSLARSNSASICPVLTIQR